MNLREAEKEAFKDGTVALMTKHVWQDGTVDRFLVFDPDLAGSVLVDAASRATDIRGHDRGAIMETTGGESYSLMNLNQDGLDLLKRLGVERAGKMTMLGGYDVIDRFDSMCIGREDIRQGRSSAFSTKFPYDEAQNVRKEAVASLSRIQDAAGRVSGKDSDLESEFWA